MLNERVEMCACLICGASVLSSSKDIFKDIEGLSQTFFAGTAMLFPSRGINSTIHSPHKRRLQRTTSLALLSTI